MTDVTAPQNRADKRWIILIAAFFLIWALRATVFYPIDNSIESESLRKLYAETLRIMIWIIPVFVYLKLIDKVSPLEYLKLSTPVGWRAIIESTIFIGLYVLGGWALRDIAEGKSAFTMREIHWPQALRILLFTLGAPIAEEIFFRGFVLRKLWDRMNFWPANFITSLLFVAIHWPYWLYSRGFQASLVVDSVLIYIFSLFMGWLVKRTNSLWPAIFGHLFNNYVSGYLRR